MLVESDINLVRIKSKLVSLEIFLARLLHIEIGLTCDSEPCLIFLFLNSTGYFCFCVGLQQHRIKQSPNFEVS